MNLKTKIKTKARQRKGYFLDMFAMLAFAISLFVIYTLITLFELVAPAGITIGALQYTAESWTTPHTYLRAPVELRGREIAMWELLAIYADARIAKDYGVIPFLEHTIASETTVLTSSMLDLHPIGQNWQLCFQYRERDGGKEKTIWLKRKEGAVRTGDGCPVFAGFREQNELLQFPWFPLVSLQGNHKVRLLYWRSGE